jgi:hypothetical protein
MRGLIWCTQSSESAMGNWALYQRKEPQVPSLRFAPVGMTILLCTQKLQRDIHDPAMKLSSRPEQLWAFGPPEVIKMGSVRQPHSMEAPPSPLSSRPELRRSVVERSAVQRSLPGNVFRQSLLGFPTSRCQQRPRVRGCFVPTGLQWLLHFFALEIFL